MDDNATLRAADAATATVLPSAPASTPAPAAAEPGPVEHEFPITVAEFCQRHSRTEKSVELLGAFYATETHRGQGPALEAEHCGRLEAFAARPIG